MSRRRSNVRQYSAEDQALTDISQEAENRLAAKRAARAEAREIRMKEIERQQKEAEEKERLGSDYGSSRSRQQSVTASSGSRRGSFDSEGTNDSTSSRDRDLKMELRTLEEKYKAAMMTSAQLDNEKQSLVYQVELLKDQLEELTESHTELQREYKDKNRNLEMTKRELQTAQSEVKALRDQNDYKDRLITESGFVIVAAENGELALERSEESPSANGPVGTGGLLLSSESLGLLNKGREGSLDDKVKALAAEKKKLVEEVKRLENLLDDEQSKQRKSDVNNLPQVNGPEMQLYEVQREASKQIHDYKFKLQKAEQDIATLEGMVGRLENQLKRYKSEAERAESVEDELKQEKRKLQRELREAQTQVDELQNQNKHLTLRLERIKQSRTALGIQ
ncbi:leucine-rich repeat flightless-interacting protein 2-like isoform X2 [Babylonia areolata]|uniref:leucine-rich repeat flightless-interacting protein 2-like isoform X2 n=1 Tax=Babylonia areolata TaxID=304850 RepID=UPI003FD4123D